MNDIITQLKNSGNLKCYIDARYGHVQDLSNNNLNGTFGGTVKMGNQSIIFDGGVGNLSLGNTGNINSICFIFKPNNLSGNILELINNSVYVTYLNSVITQTGFTTPIIYVNGIVSSTISADKFYFVCLTQAANINASAINIGEANSVNFNGQVKCFMAFNKVLSATEVSLIYSQLNNIKFDNRVIVNSTPSFDASKSGLIGYWPLDNINGVTVSDDSGNNLNGTLVGGPVIENTAMGMAMKFDGIDSSIGPINVGNIKSLSLWIKPVNTNDGLLELINNDTYLSIATSAITQTNFTTPTIYVNGSSASANILLNDWNNIVITTNTSVNASSLNIGESNGNFYQGHIKDVRIYNCVLDATTIQNMYLSGRKAMVSTMFGTKVSSGNQT